MISLRRARLDDADALGLVAAVQRYYVELYGSEDTDPLQPERFVAPDGGFVIGDVDGVAAAMGGWSRAADPQLGSVRRMYVAAEHRRHGFAARILDWIADDARAAGVRRLQLTTGSPQAAAVAFYRSAGFTDVEPYGYWAEHGYDAVFLGRDL